MTCSRPGNPIGPKTGGGFLPPVFFVLLLGVFGNGGDWPLATFAIRGGLFAVFGVFLLRGTLFPIRLNFVDVLVLSLWAFGAASLARGGYKWISYQWFLHHSAALILYALLRGLPEADERFPGAAGAMLLVSAVAQVLIAFFQRVFLGEARPYGTLENPNFLAELLVYAGVVAWVWGRRAENRESRKKWLTLLIPFFLAGIGLTQSRGGFLLVVALGTFLLADRVGWRKSALSVSLLVAAVILIPNPLRDRFLGLGDPFAFERINMWKASVRIFLENPLGVGVGHFKYYWHMARDPVEGSIIRYAKFARTPHSEFFSLLSELGIPGAIGFLGLGTAGLVSLRRAVAWKEPVALAATLILLTSYLHSFIEYNYHVLGILLINAAALAIVSNRLWTPLLEKEVRTGPMVKGLIVALLGIFLAYSGMTVAGTVLEERGSDAFKERRMGEADRWFMRAGAVDPWCSTYPDSASAARYRLYEGGKGRDYLVGAIETEQEAYLRNPLDYRYPARLGFLYSKAMDHFPYPERARILASSIRSYDQAIALNPYSADLRYLKASLLSMTGRKAEARSLVEAILSDEPRYVKGWLLLAGLLEDGDAKAALAAYEKAVSVHSVYRDLATESYEKEFVDLDGKMVEARIRLLRSRLGR
jgi:tetratricopeptide (TPR) repeat protein